MAEESISQQSKARASQRERYERLKRLKLCVSCRRPTDSRKITCIFCRRTQRAKRRERAAGASLEIRLRRYKLTRAKYDAMLQAQDGLCAICRSPTEKERLCVDHDHATGAVRGLLCKRCNTGIGYLRDSIELLDSAIQYLKRNA